MQDDDSKFTTQDMEDGTYYRAARSWYSELFHTPIAERSYFVIIIALALINGYFAIQSFLGVFPITPLTPFITYSSDVWEDLPRIRRLAVNETEDRNIAVMRFMIQNYLASRENYDLKDYELRYRSIWNQSTPEVFEAYKAQMDASNPYSPYRLYTNKDKRTVDIVSLSYKLGAEASQAQIVFEASVRSLESGEEVRHSKWKVDMTFKYTNFVVDQSLDKYGLITRVFGLTGEPRGASGDKRKVVPMTFVVSDYQVKELLE